ncbi:MAG: FkbM family methyltransferase, partial [Nitrosopumilus sp.]|nr:FkbM family methyltransferase [Nitrosopumilus sp.]
MFKRIIKPGFNLIEVGGHIGYITNFFSNLVQTNGSVYVFEPGTNNLPYLKENIKDLTNVTLIEKAISDSNGTAKFYIENISGQNNSLLPDYGKLVLELSYVKNIKKETEVETITLDSFCQTCGISPDFIKIDIEGAELLAVQGMINLLKRNPPMLMIEITKNSKTVYEILRNLNYVLLTPTGEKIEISNV